jgi:hypothetical protein
MVGMSDADNWFGSAWCILMKTLKKWLVGIEQVLTDLLLIVNCGPHAVPVREGITHCTHPLQ